MVETPVTLQEGVLKFYYIYINVKLKLKLFIRRRTNDNDFSHCSVLLLVLFICDDWRVVLLQPNQFNF